MEEERLLRTALFRGLAPGELAQALALLAARERAYPKNAPVFRAGDTAHAMGLVLSGGVRVEHDDAWGNKGVFAHVGPGGVFAESYACLPHQPLLVSAVAAQDSRVLLLDVRALLGRGGGEALAGRLLGNLLAIAMGKNLALSRRMLHTSPKTIRGRLASYLSEQALLAGGRQFTIPFDRQQLADYLGVDRSALSGELSKMRRDGLLTCRKNAFTLLQPLEP